MTDSLADTPPVAVAVCPACEPDRDPIAEILVSVPCHRHQEDGGIDDDAVRKTDPIGIGFGDAGGESNVKFCALIHRGRT